MGRRRDADSADVASLQAAHTPPAVGKRLREKPAPSYLQDFIEELGFGATAPNEFRAAAATLIAFLAVGFLPLIVFVYDLAVPGDVGRTFMWSAILTGAAFFAVGALKSRFVDQSWWRSATETLVVGGVAASLAYAAGAFLQAIA